MPSPSSSSLRRRLFGTVSIGSMPTRHIAVLLYLASTERRERENSLKRLGDALGVSENTVWAGLRNAYRRGYVEPTKDAPPPDEPPGRDPCFIEVTAEGRRALRPFFNVVGLFGLVSFIAISLGVGGLIGYSYGATLPYLPQYAAIVVASFAGIAVVYTFATYQIWRTARDFRRNQLFKMFKAATVAEDKADGE
jgi:hypothetical protein